MDIARGRIRIRQTCRQILSIGAGSQSVVVVTGAFTGAVFTAQVYGIFKDLQVENASGGLVSLAMCRELGPVLVALMITGRVGAAIAAEIGTMKVTEQIDALRAMAVEPVEYLVVPRLVAMMISIPLLIAESIAFGILAAYLVGVVHYGIPEAAFMTHVNNYTDQFFKDNLPVVELVTEHLNLATIRQYQNEERNLMASRKRLADRRLTELFSIMRHEILSPPEKVKQLGEELAEYHAEPAFEGTKTMGELVMLNLDASLRGL